MPAATAPALVDLTDADLVERLGAAETGAQRASQEVDEHARRATEAFGRDDAQAVAAALEAKRGAAARRDAHQAEAEAIRAELTRRHQPVVAAWRDGCRSTVERLAARQAGLVRAAEEQLAALEQVVADLGALPDELRQAAVAAQRRLAEIAAAAAPVGLDLGTVVDWELPRPPVGQLPARLEALTQRLRRVGG